MAFTRRSFLAAGLPLLALPQLGAASHAYGKTPQVTPSDPRMERRLGPANARMVVEEWFSLTCVHCARFAIDIFPRIKKELILPGKIAYVFKEFPLDQVALMASMVARSLPAERYEPFILSLFVSQDRWAFSQVNDPRAELRKMAALAGMPRDQFERVLDDSPLRQEILDEQSRAQSEYKIDSTPTFRFNSTQYSGELDYDAFVKKALVTL